MGMTPCECSGPGWCARHGCEKLAPYYHLCRRNRRYFDAWEAGRVAQADSAAESTATALPGPNLSQRALNFGLALVRLASHGFTAATEEEIATRLAICRSCASCDVPRLTCREHSCGCDLTVKARWASERCPLGNWPESAVPST